MKLFEDPQYIKSNMKKKELKNLKQSYQNKLKKENQRLLIE